MNEQGDPGAAGAGHRIPSVVPPSIRKKLASWQLGREIRWRRIPGVRNVGPGKAVLTFDDGPADENTPDVLKALAAADVNATFFLLGSEVKSSPQLAGEIVAQGHEVALHGFNHVRHDKSSEAESRADIEAGLEAIEEATQQRPRWFRPPFGRMSKGAMAACEDSGLRLAYWSDWGVDWEEVDDMAIAETVTAGLGSGSIVLLHDSVRFGRRSSALPTADAVASIVEAGRRKNLTWHTLSGATEP